MRERVGIEAARERMVHAFAVSRDNPQNMWPQEPQPPDGLYNEHQLARWQRAEPIIRRSVELFLYETGIVNHQLEFDFSDHSRHIGSKEVEITLKFREDETDQTWNEEKPYRKVVFYYDPGGKFIRESIKTGYTHLVKPKDKSLGLSITVDEALALLEDESSDTFTTVHVTSEIEVNSLKKLLRVLSSNPYTVTSPDEGLLIKGI